MHCLKPAVFGFGDSGFDELFGAFVAKTSEDENHVAAATTGGQRVIKELSGDWWLAFQPEVAGLLGSLLHHLATGIKAAKLPNKAGTVEPVLDNLSRWADDKATNSPSTAKLKASREKVASNEEALPVVKQTSVAGDRIKTKPKSQGEGQISRSIDALAEQLAKNTAQLERITSDLRHGVTREAEQWDVHARRLADQLSEVFSSSLRALHEQGTQVQAVVNQLSPEVARQFASVEARLKAIEGGMGNRVHIRDTIHILEIKQEVERFVEADLIRKISLQVMPVWAPMQI
jgi:hypothetical protein